MENHKEKTQRLFNELEELEKATKRKREEWQASIRQAKLECSHKYSNGASAWEHDYVLSKCQICGSDDL